MNNKLANIVTHVVLILIGIFGIVSMNKLDLNGGGDSSVFPKIICAVIIILSIISLIVELRKSNKIIPVGNLKLIFATLGLTVLYIIVWTKTGLFYVATAIFTFSVFWLYSKDRKDYKNLLKKGVPLTALTILFVYILFEKAMSIRF